MTRGRMVSIALDLPDDAAMDARFKAEVLHRCIVTFADVLSANLRLDRHVVLTEIERIAGEIA